jgi:RHS repeat-associated protein
MNKLFATLCTASVMLFASATRGATDDRPQGVAARIWGIGNIAAGQAGDFSLAGTYLNPDPSVGGDLYRSADTATSNGGALTTNLGGSTNGIVRVEPGKVYQLMIGGANLQTGEINIIPPAGYNVLIDGVKRTRSTFNGAWLYYFQVVENNDLRPRAAGDASGSGATAVEWHSALGALLNGADAGTVSLIDSGTRTDWSPLFTPSALDYETASNEVWVDRVWDEVRQIVSNEAAVDIVTLSSTSFELRYYHPDQVNYSATPRTFTGTPFVTYRVAQGSTSHTLSFTREIRDVTDTTTNFPISRTEVMSLTQAQTWPTFVWTRSPWTVQGQTPVNETIDQSNGTTSRTAEDLILRTVGGSTPTIETHRTYTTVPAVGEFVASETLGSGGNNPVSTYDYYTDPASPGNLSYLKSATYAYGGWDAYDYYDDGSVLTTRSGTIQHRYRPFVNTPATPSLNASQGEVTTYQYTNDEFGAQRAPSLISTSVNGVETARSTFAYTFETRYANNYGINRIERTDYANSSSPLTTVICTYVSSWGDSIYRGELFSITTPDNVRKAYAYEKGTWDSSTNTFTPGTGNASRVSEITGTATNAGTYTTTYNNQDIEGIYLVDGKSLLETTVRDTRALTVRRETAIWFNGAWVQTGWTNFTFDMAGNLTGRTSSNGAIYSAVYTGGLKTSETDEQGVTITYTYDAAGRVDTATRQGAGTIGSISFKYAYDAAGNRTEERVGWGQSEQIVASAQFDSAGRVTSQTAPGLSPAVHTYDVAARTHTVTRPTGATEIETFNVDAQLASITGTGVVPAYRTYGVESDGRRFAQVNGGTATSPRVVKQWMDWLGRHIQKQHPGFTGQPDVVEQYYYDSAGRLARATRTGYGDRLFQYNVMSQLVRTGLDVNGNGNLDLASNDRIADADTTLESYNGAYWLRSDTKVYAQIGVATPSTLSTTRYRLTGFTGNRRAEIQQTDAEGNLVTVQLDLDRNNHTGTRTESRSGISGQRITSYLDGFPTTVTGFDGLTTTVGYDALLRLASVTDSRNNTTSTTYVPGTMRAATTTDASNAQVAMGYDTAGRLIWRRDARNYYTRFEYNSRDQVMHQWGDGAMPVAFGYDATYGDRVSMSTFRGGSGWESATWPTTTGTADTTTWTYDTPSGLLTTKTDAAGHAASQTYNARGQTATRTLARGVSASYAYDSTTGELTGIDYSDTTPDIACTYTRIGQLDSVADASGTHDFVYDATRPWRLTNEALDAFYGNKVISRLYETTGVIGRNDGFRVGNAAGSNSDVEQDYGYMGNGRFETVASGFNSNASTRTFRYGYLANAALVSGITIDGSHPFTVTRAYEATRDLLTSISAKWSGTTRTQFDYAYDERRMRKSVVQSGDAFADYGDAIHRIFSYNGRGELIADVAFLNSDPNSQVSPLPGRHYDFAYDNAGNRTSSNRTGVSGLADTYITNALNQYASRENNTLAVSGTANSDSAVAVKGQSTAAGRQGRYWSDEVVVNNGSHPWSGSLAIYTAKPGAGLGGSDLYRMDTRTAWLAAALQSFTYDNDGNLISDGVWDYLYDAENRMVSAETSSNALLYGFPNRLLQFKYDYAGRRIQKRVINLDANSDVYCRRYLYDGSNLVAEFNAPNGSSLGALLRSYTWGLDNAGSIHRAGGVGGLLQITDHASGNTYLPTYDGNGNIMSLTNASTGTLAAVYEYSGYGESLREEVIDPIVADQPFRFSTQYYDRETGLYCYLRRHYDPKTGRWLERDPLQEQGGLNLYGFCGNNPIDYWDVRGEEDDGYGGSVADAAADQPVVMDTYTVTADPVPTDAFYVTGDSPVQVGDYFSTPDGTTWLATSSAGTDESGVETMNAIPVSGVPQSTDVPPPPDYSSNLQQDAQNALATATADLQAQTNDILSQPIDIGPPSIDRSSIDTSINVPEAQTTPDAGPDPLTASSFEIGVDAAARGLLAGIDGLIPFFDPFASMGLYDPNDPAYHASQVTGEITQAVAVTVGTAGLGEVTSVATAAEDLAAEETPVIIKEGSLINRVWDSGWEEGSSLSGPFGGSYAPGGALPINADTAIIDRGLVGFPNNAQMGAVYEVTGDIPAILRTSIGGTEPELVIAPEFRDALQILTDTISQIPPGP